MFKNTGISLKLTALLVCSVTGFAILAYFALSILHAALVADRVEKVTNLAQAARDVAKSYYDRAQAGEFSQSDAQARAKSALRAVRYGSGDYFFIYSFDGTNLMHPRLPSGRARII